MKYLILIYHNPDSRQIWESFSEEQRGAGLHAYAVLNEQLAASGELLAAEALDEPGSAKHVILRDGQTVASDGPFAEAKEHLAGFYFVDVESEQRALDIAARIPEARFGLVELRPVMDLSAFEP